MQRGIRVDTSEFDKALVEYAAASRKDFADIANRQLLNFGIQGAKIVKKASRDKIKAVAENPKWPGFVSKFLRKRQGKFTKAEFKRASRMLIRQRTKAIGFLRFFFVTLSQTVAPWSRGKGKKGKAFSGFSAYGKPATNAVPTASVTVRYDYKHRGGRTANGAQRILEAYYNSALLATVLDIRKYVDKKIGRTAKKYSARGA